MVGSDEGAWLFQLETKQLLSCLVTFRVALYVSFKTENEGSKPKKKCQNHWRTVTKAERNGDFNTENVLFIFDLISYKHFYGNSVYCGCMYLNIKTVFSISRHFTLHCALALRTLQHVESNSGLPFTTYVYWR